MKDVPWHNSTAIYSWGTIGIWPETTEAQQGSRGDPTSAHVSHDLLLCGDNQGYVSIYNYPCPIKGVSAAQYLSSKGTDSLFDSQVECLKARAHSSAVAQVRFNCDATYRLFIH